MVAVIRGPAPGRAGAALCLVLAAAGPAAPAAAQSFLDEYSQGIEAAEAEDWPEAERHMRQAIDRRPEESRRLLRFLHFRPYVPHLYLGLALAEQDRCEAALEALAESERQGVVPGLEDEQRLLGEARERCRGRLAAAADAHRRHEELTEALEDARDLHGAIHSLGPPGGPRSDDGVAQGSPDGLDRDLTAAWQRGEPSLEERLERAGADLERAEAALAAPTETPAELDSAAELTRSVLARLEGIHTEAELRREAVRSRRQAALERVAAARRRARELVAATGTLAEGVDVIARRRASLEELADRAGAVRTGTELSLDELSAVERALERGVAALGAVAEAPPDRLVAAAGAWLDGRPREVLELLADPEGGDSDGTEGVEADRSEPDPDAHGESSEPGELDRRTRVHALLLRAAAAFDLFHAGGGREPELLEQARRSARECRRLAPGLEPLPRAFSPRFRRFFDDLEPTAGAEPAQEPEPPPAPGHDP